jgi:hypothetical protein
MNIRPKGKSDFMDPLLCCFTFYNEISFREITQFSKLYYYTLLKDRDLNTLHVGSFAMLLLPAA